MAERSIEEFMDRCAIRDQIELYADLLNHRDWEKFGSLLAEGFVWSCTEPTAGRIEGRDAFIKMVSTVQQYQYGFVFQMPHAIVIEEIIGNRAKAHHTLHIYSDRFTYFGIYYDELIKEADGVWRFRRRDYQITYYDVSPQSGKIYRQLPDPNYGELPGP